KSELLQTPASKGTVLVKLLEQRLLAFLLKVLRLVRVGHVPAILGLGHKGWAVLLQTAQILVVGREVAVDLARNLTRAVVLNEVVFEQGGKFRLRLVLLPACPELADEIGVDLLVG